MDSLLLMKVFVRAVEMGSFSAVARELETSQPSISRQIAALERHLGARLLHRSTRKLALTPEGERYFADSRRVLEALSEAESNVRGEGGASGLLRISCPTALARTHIIPRMRALFVRFPGLNLELHVSDRLVRLVEEGMDLAIRIGDLDDSSLRARRVGVAERVCVASREYLKKRGTPLSPTDLKKHDCVLYTRLSSGSVWSLRHGNVPVTGRIGVNTPDAIVQAVQDGLGIAYAPVWLFADSLRNGTTQAVLLDHVGPARPISIVYPDRRLLPARARVFIDFIAREFAREITLNVGAAASIMRRAAGRRRR